jgi:hypothetical protein
MSSKKPFNKRGDEFLSKHNLYECPRKGLTESKYNEIDSVYQEGIDLPKTCQTDMFLDILESLLFYRAYAEITKTAVKDQNEITKDLEVKLNQSECRLKELEKQVKSLTDQVNRQKKWIEFLSRFSDCVSNETD